MNSPNVTFEVFTQGDLEFLYTRWVSGKFDLSDMLNTIAPHLDHSQLSRYQRIKNTLKQEEFVLSRALIHQKFPELQIKFLPSGKPIFPKSHLGSISHHKNHAILATAYNQETRFKGLGVDIEKTVVSTKLIPKIAPQENLLSLSKNLNLSEEETLAVIFSAKESTYKAAPCSLQRELTFSNVVATECTFLTEGHGELILESTLRPAKISFGTKIRANYQFLNKGNHPLLLTYVIF